MSLNVAYPCEILPYRLRANGLMIQSLATNVMLFFNQYVNPIGIQHASWRYYFLFEATLLVQVSYLPKLCFLKLRYIVAGHCVFLLYRDERCNA